MAPTMVLKEKRFGKAILFFFLMLIGGYSRLQDLPLGGWHLTDEEVLLPLRRRTHEETCSLKTVRENFCPLETCSLGCTHGGTCPVVCTWP